MFLYSGMVYACKAKVQKVWWVRYNEETMFLDTDTFYLLSLFVKPDSNLSQEVRKGIIRYRRSHIEGYIPDIKDAYAIEDGNYYLVLLTKLDSREWVVINKEDFSPVVPQERVLAGMIFKYGHVFDFGIGCTLM